jgi:hypothetical protein
MEAGVVRADISTKVATAVFSRGFDGKVLFSAEKFFNQ